MGRITRILVIDDESSVREMIRRALESKGYEVDMAEQGAAGLALFQRTHFDLLITDIVMPDQDGLETILAIRRARPDLPILAISGGGSHAWTDVLETATVFGASQTLQKPFAIQQLIECVQELLRKAADSGGRSAA
jgi:DNA-binding response OmpR family regulator